MKPTHIALAILVSGLVGCLSGFAYGRHTKGQSCELQTTKATVTTQGRVIKKAQADIKRANATGAQVERKSAAIEAQFSQLETEAAHAPSDLSIVAACLMSACASGVTPTQDPLPVLPQARLLVPPQPLPPTDIGAIPDLESNHREVAKAYHLLATRLCGLLDFLEVTTASDGCAPYRDP